MTELRLNARDDVGEISREFAAQGRVRIRDILVTEDAALLHEYLSSHKQWWQLINTPDGVIELSRKKRRKMTSKQRSKLDSIVYEGARRGFQYRYEGLRVPDDPDRIQSDDDPLSAFARLMSSEPMLALLRQIIGNDTVAFADGHATSYGPGDLLTEHDDDVAGKNRLAAYVYGLTRAWRPEWGGLLLFHGPDSATVHGQIPQFNVLDLFAVPQPHSVSVVTPSAPARRYAITGWLRAN